MQAQVINWFCIMLFCLTSLFSHLESSSCHFIPALKL